MKTMNSICTSLAGLLILIATGCATNPLTLPQKARDNGEPYRFAKEDYAKLKPMFKQTKQSIAVQVVTKALSDSGLADEAQRKIIENNFLSDLQSSLNDVSYLRTVSANDDLVEFINSGYDQTTSQKMDIPDYILLAKVVYVNVAKDKLVQNILVGSAIGLGGVATGLATLGESGSSKTGAIVAGTGAVGAGVAAAAVVPVTVDVKVYFELFNRAQNRTEKNRTLNRKKAGVSSDAADAAIVELLEDCAEEYLNLSIASLSPLGMVVKTVGDGRFAYVSLGEDTGLRPKDNVQFLQRGESVTLDSLMEDEGTDADASAASENGADDDESIPLDAVAYGTVIDNIPPEKGRAWVKIKDCEKVSVKKGQGVRILPQPVKRKDRLLNRFGL